MFGRLMNGAAHKFQNTVAAMPSDQQLAIKSIVDRSQELVGTPTAELTKMFTLAVRAVYAASDDSEQREHMLEACAVGLALTTRLSN